MFVYKIRHRTKKKFLGYLDAYRGPGAKSHNPWYEEEGKAWNDPKSALAYAKRAVMRRLCTLSDLELVRFVERESIPLE